MATIKHKRGTSNPSTSNVAVGELAINTTDGGLFTQTDGGSVVEIGGSVSDLYAGSNKALEATNQGVKVYGDEGNIGALYLSADQADDNPDKWVLWCDNSSVIKLQNYTNGSWETSIECNGDGNVELYYGDAKCLETLSTGVKTWADLTVENDLYVGDDIILTDNLFVADDGVAYFGANNDLLIWHSSGSNASYIKEQATGHLYLLADDFQIYNTAGTEVKAKYITDGAVELYYNNAKKAETVTGGFTVTGTCTATAFAGDGSALTGVGVSSDGSDNTFAGSNAGEDLTSGSSNTGFGAGALKDLTDSEYNTAVGYEAARKLTTGDYNTAIGGYAFGDPDSATTGHRNTGVGYGAFSKLTSGSWNVGIGDQIGQAITTANYNVLLGHQAGRNISTAHNNVFLGYQAGYYLNTAENIAIGKQALSHTSNTGSQNIVIGKDTGKAITTGTGNVCLGHEAGDALATGDNNIIIGKTAAASSTSVGNEITLGNTDITKFRVPGLNFVVKDTTATEDYVLTVDANGEAGWEAASAGGPTDVNVSKGFEAPATVPSNWSIGANNNAMFPGPMTVASGATVTVPANRTLTVV